MGRRRLIPRHRRAALRLLLVGLLCAAACGQRTLPPALDGKIWEIKDLGPADGPPACPGCICKDPKGDEDSDGIANGDEGCLSGRDSDGDKIPDWQDFDSDDDGIYDELEKGQRDNNGKCKGAKPPHDSWPCDTDGDGIPDYLDQDSDGDGLFDGQEDANGDGQLGCCLTTCNKPLGKQKSVCLLSKDGCGAGQTCVSGLCSPPAAFSCSEGETDPTKKQTFPEGLDDQLATWICRDATADKPQGRKPVQQRGSSQGDWRLALPLAAKYGDLKIANAKAKEAAAAIDLTGSEVAGFVISRDTTHSTAADALAAMLKSIKASPPGGSGSVTQIASGIQGRSHDRYDTVLGTTLQLDLTVAQSTPAVRSTLVAGLLGRPVGQLGNLPAPYGSQRTKLLLRLTTVKRVWFKTDKDGDQVNAAGQKIRTHGGDPVDSGDKSKWRLLVMGAVVSPSTYHDYKSQAHSHTDDLSDGTALAKASDRLVNECDVLTIDRLPTADIIWVIDESSSMSSIRQDLVNNINNVFARALSSGLDFRMGVTGVNDPKGSYAGTVGRFCSKVTTNIQDSGGVDRFLLPSEQTIFYACIKNPPGYGVSSPYGLANAAQAVKQHLPRASSKPDRVRPDAQLAVIVVSDAPPQSLVQALGFASWPNDCALTAVEQAKRDAVLKPHLSLFSGADDPQARASLHFVGGLCGTSASCGAAAGIGYLELAHKLGGQSAEICQKDLGESMKVVIDDVVAAASPLKLERQAVSPTLALALDGVEIKRSVSNGFDYRAASNTLVLTNVKYKKGSQVITSYKYWDSGLPLGP
jgi:hypothetical protein